MLQYKIAANSQGNIQRKIGTNYDCSRRHTHFHTTHLTSSMHSRNETWYDADLLLSESERERAREKEEIFVFSVLSVKFKQITEKSVRVMFSFSTPLKFRDFNFAKMKHSALFCDDDFVSVFILLIFCMFDSLASSRVYIFIGEKLLHCVRRYLINRTPPIPANVECRISMQLSITSYVFCIYKYIYQTSAPTRCCFAFISHFTFHACEKERERVWKCWNRKWSIQMIAYKYSIYHLYFIFCVWI